MRMMLEVAELSTFGLVSGKTPLGFLFRGFQVLGKVPLVFRFFLSSFA